MSFYCVYGYADNDCGGWTEDFGNLEDAKNCLSEIMAEDEITDITETEGSKNSIVHYKTKDGYNYGISMFN